MDQQNNFQQKRSHWNFSAILFFGSRWEGVSPSGVIIGGYLDSNGNINREVKR